MKLRWLDMLISVLLAFTLWFVLSGTGKSVSSFDVRLDYRGLPQDMVITSPLVNSISVRVSGSAGLMRTFNNRNHSYQVDLSNLKIGENIINISNDKLPFRGATDISVVEPAQIIIVTDSIESKSVPLILKLHGDLPTDYTISAETAVSEVVVRGASSLTKTIEDIELSVDIPENLTVGSKQLIKVLPFPEGISLKPSEVNITFYTDIKRQQVSIKRRVIIDHTTGLNGTVEPDEVTLHLDLPASLAQDAENNEEIIAYVKSKSTPNGNGKLQVQATLPKLGKVISIEPDRVTFVPAPR